MIDNRFKVLGTGEYRELPIQTDIIEFELPPSLNSDSLIITIKDFVIRLEVMKYEEFPKAITGKDFDLDCKGEFSFRYVDFNLDGINTLMKWHSLMNSEVLSKKSDLIGKSIVYDKDSKFRFESVTLKDINSLFSMNSILKNNYWLKLIDKIESGFHSDIELKLTFAFEYYKTFKQL